MSKSLLDALTPFDSVPRNRKIYYEYSKKLQIGEDEISKILLLREMKKALSKKLD